MPSSFSCELLLSVCETLKLLCTSFQAVKKTLVMMERLDFYENRVKALECDKAVLEKLLVVAQSTTRDAMDKVAQYSAKLEATNAELIATKGEEEKLKAEVEVLKKKVSSEADAAYKEGLKVSADHYKKEVVKIRDKTWSKAWVAALKEAGVPAEHPAYKKSAFPGVPSPSSATTPAPAPPSSTSDTPTTNVPSTGDRKSVV